MTKAEHIAYWKETAESNWLAAQDLFGTGKYLECLFLAHLTIEKLSKAHWVQDNADDFPPRTHNILRLWGDTQLVPSPDQENTAADLNRFQLEGRYPDYEQAVARQATESYTRIFIARHQPTALMVTQQAAIVRVRQFLEELRQLGIPLRQAILFGSFARHEQHEYSDIDLALVGDNFIGAAVIDMKPFVRSVVKHIDIEPHTFSPEQFTDWNPFVQEILRTGIVIGEWEPVEE